MKKYSPKNHIYGYRTFKYRDIHNGPHILIRPYIESRMNKENINERERENACVRDRKSQCPGYNVSISRQGPSMSKARNDYVGLHMDICLHARSSFVTEGVTTKKCGHNTDHNSSS